jgi:GTP-binding protein LepA
MKAEMPLRELMRGFFDRLKSVSSGFASLSYEIIGMRPADVLRLDILVAEELDSGIYPHSFKERMQFEAEQMVEKWKNFSQDSGSILRFKRKRTAAS